MILFINACVRKQSRTKILADYLIAKSDTQVEELRLIEMQFPTVDQAFLKKRELLISAGELDHPVFTLARQFAEADCIIIAAPYWDLSFPAILKQYLEQVNVVGITFQYSADGIPMGLCKARKLYYVMTAGGQYVPEEFGYGYVKALAQSFYGIRDVELIQAVGLDIEGAAVDGILKTVGNSIGHFMDTAEHTD